MGSSEMTPEQLGEDMSRDMSKTPRPCKACGIDWTPEGWNFYDLCESCFPEFNAQKMNSRFTGEPGHESVDAWVAEKSGRDG